MGLFSFFSKSPQKAEEKGDAYFSANNFGQAKLEYETALDILKKKHPDDADMKDRVLEKLKNSKESLARQHLENGDRLVTANSLNEAENLFRIALSLTENPELQQKLRERFSSDRNEIFVGETGADSELTDETEPDDSDNEFEVLCAILPDETVQAYRSYGDTFKEGFIALSNADFARAAEKLRLAMEENPSDDSHIPVELATALIHLGETEQAIELLTVYLQNNPSSFQGITILCDILCELKQFDQAHGVIDQSPENVKETVEAHLHKARIYFYEKNYQSAEEIYSRIIEVIGWREEVARELARTLAASEKNEEAADIYADLLNKCSGCGQRVNPLDKKAFADLLFKMNDFSEKTLNLYMDLANDYEEIRSECFSKVSTIYSNIGNEKEAARFQELAEATG